MKKELLYWLSTFIISLYIGGQGAHAASASISILPGECSGFTEDKDKHLFIRTLKPEDRESLAAVTTSLEHTAKVYAAPHTNEAAEKWFDIMKERACKNIYTAMTILYQGEVIGYTGFLRMPVLEFKEDGTSNYQEPFKGLFERLALTSKTSKGAALFQLVIKNNYHNGPVFKEIVESMFKNYLPLLITQKASLPTEKTPEFSKVLVRVHSEWKDYQKLMEDLGLQKEQSIYEFYEGLPEYVYWAETSPTD